MWYNFKAIARLHMHTHPERQKPIWVRVVVWGYYRELEAMWGGAGEGKKRGDGRGKGIDFKELAYAIVEAWQVQILME